LKQLPEPVRQSAKELDSKYRPSQNNGDQDASGPISMAIKEKIANYRPDSGNGVSSHLTQAQPIRFDLL